jgi:succinate dehydrogenase hydrophobic anchor subunit
MNLRTAPQRGVNFDYIMWLFTRFSALGMYLLALIGITGALIMGARQQMALPNLLRWAFTPDVNHVLNTNVPNIDAWKTLFWQVMASLFVLLAGAHGLHGVLSVEEDYLTNARWRQALRLLILFIWLVMSVIGIYVIFTY